jgi:hypothetical protein
MKKYKYEILQKNILSVVLYNAGQYWYDRNLELIPWSATTAPVSGTTIMDVKWYSDITYEAGDTIYYNGKIYKSLTDSNLNKIPSSQTTFWVEQPEAVTWVDKGYYYRWNGNLWVNIGKNRSAAYPDYEIPITLDAKADELGIMVGFDGEVDQVEQLCNFTYKASGNTITVYNTTNTNTLKRVVDATFQINWGDSTTSSISILGNVTKTYSTPGNKTISITMNSPWTVQTLSRTVNLPLAIGNPTSLGTLSFTFPYTDYGVALSGSTKTPTALTFVAAGKSRIIEKKLYGGNTYSGVTSTSLPGTTLTCSKYTVDGLDYYDCSDGVTYITGKVPNHIINGTTGFTSYNSNTDFAVEYVTNKMLTRNEHFLGFISEPQVYSDIFVERGKMGVSEFNLRLGEIDNIGELDIYGNGFFVVKKQ